MCGIRRFAFIWECRIRIIRVVIQKMVKRFSQYRICLVPNISDQSQLFIQMNRSELIVFSYSISGREVRQVPGSQSAMRAPLSAFTFIGRVMHAASRRLDVGTGIQLMTKSTCVRSASQMSARVLCCSSNRVRLDVFVTQAKTQTAATALGMLTYNI